MGGGHNHLDEAPQARRRKRAAEVVLVDVPRKPPPAPKGLRGKRERELWRELWADPVAALWSASDGRLVARLAVLLARIEADGRDCPGWVFGLSMGLEDRLALNVRSRRAAGIVLEPPAGKVDERGGLDADLTKTLALNRRRGRAAMLAGVEVWPA